MQKIRKSITYMIIYLILFIQVVFAQSNSGIKLPSIPIYLEDNVPRESESSTIQLYPGFIRTYKKENSLIGLKIDQTYTHIDILGYKALLVTCFGVIGAIDGWSRWKEEEYYIVDGKEYRQRGEMAILYPISRGLMYYFGSAVVLFLPEIIQSGVYNAFDESYITKFSTSINEFRGNESILLRKFGSTTKGKALYYNVNPELLKILKNKFNNWIRLHDLVKNYNIDEDYSSIDLWLATSINYLGKPKGEFETTLQYRERLKQEELTHRSIEAEYQQQLAQRKDVYEMNQLKKHREIEKLTNEIQFERPFKFSMSNYDADKQVYTFIIPDLGLRKKLVVPINEAPRFKANTDKLVIKQMVKPSLYGRWIPVYDDVVLADASTGKVIPWEGEVPTYAAAPVTNPPSLSATVDLSEPSGEGYLDAEELATLKVTLTNNGAGPAKATRISVSQDSGPTLYFDVSTTVSAIAPGKSHTERFQITVPENVSNGKVAYTVSFLEAQGFEPAPVQFTAEVRAQREPLLTLVDFGVVDQSGDGKVSKGESAEITARIQNKGQGMAKSVRVNINPEGNDVFMHPDSKKEFNLGNIPSGAARDVMFTVLTNNRVGHIASVELKLNEKRSRFSKSEFVSLEIDKQQSQLAPLAFTGTSSDVAIANLATLTVEIEKDIPIGKKKNPDALAVVFGVENYKNVSDASFAKRDATYMKEYFEKVLGIPGNQNSIYFKTDDDVGMAEFNKVFSKDGWLDKRVKKGKTDLFIYYAGHGAPDIKENKAYLIPYDGDPNYASQTGYEMDVLYEQLGKIGARSTTVFLDACFSGANRESEILLAGARPVFMEVKSGIPGNVTVFSAAGGKEVSSAWPEKKHGLFSYYLMKGMRGDADANKDKKITVGELGDYIRENVSNQAGMLDREQTPELKTRDKKKVLIQY